MAIPGMVYAKLNSLQPHQKIQAIFMTLKENETCIVPF